MSWETLPIEYKLEEKLVAELGDAKGKEFYGLYTTARKDLVEDILKEISKIEANLTDHGPDHIINVLKNVYKLLDSNIENLSALELYSLCLIVLFHDVGNIKKRNQHNKKISEIYTYVRKDLTKFWDEKLIVITAAGAHCGIAEDGTDDTLKSIINNNFFLDDGPIRLRDLAAILRFADELAEGIQRTSNYMLINHEYNKKSEIFHKYASITKVNIDYPGQRIRLTYNINLQKKRKLLDKELRKFKELMQFAYYRIIKLDQERKYNKHYCSFLSNYKSTSVQFNIHINGELQNLDLDELTLTDLTIPGEKFKDITQFDERYKLETIINQLNG